MPAYPLGKRPPRFDPRTLRLSRYVDFAQVLPYPPPRVNWAQRVAQWGVMLNDRLGCCTISAIGHGVQTWSANVGTEITIADAQILAAYSAVSGYDPRTGANDNGAVILDVLNYWRTTGVGGHKLFAYAACEPGNTTHLQATIALFAFANIGVGLPISAQNQSGPGLLWDVPPGGPVGNGAPWSWGGHDVIVLDYDAAADTYDCMTWGFIQKMTGAFFRTYCDEAYACLGPEWQNAQGQTPAGFDYQALAADLALIPGQDPIPQPQPSPQPTTEPHIAAAQAAVAQLQTAQQQNPRSTTARLQLRGGQLVASAVTAVG